MAKGKNLFHSWINDSIKYIGETKNYIWFVMGLFFASALIGFFFSSNFGFFDILLKQVVERAAGLKGIDLIIFIFNNNIQSAIISILLGIFLGVIPFINAVTNGLILGYVLEKVWIVSGFDNFWRILPHGIFELPAVFIAIGLGMKLGMFIFAKKKLHEFKRRLYDSFKVLICIIIPLLIIAAIIEGLIITLI